MLDCSAAYRTAITGDARRILLRAVIDIISPDIVFGEADSSGQTAYSRPEELHDKVFDNPVYCATLEPNRWLLNGTARVFPDDPAQAETPMGFVGSALSGADGAFSPAVWVEERFSNVSILQACSVYFPTAPWDGYPVDLTIEVKQGGTAYYTKTITNNTAAQISLTGFTVNNPDAIRVTVTRWSMPGRRLRVVEIIPGIYETWGNDIIASFSAAQQAAFSCLSLPYGTCTLSMDNQDRRFEPRSKDGIFRSIEERQGIAVSIGVELPGGGVEYKPLGVFYQFSGGWKTGDNGLTMQWSLVDIIGLLADRQYLPPDTLPVTAEEWIASLVAQLGTNFTGRYQIDPSLAALPLTAEREGVTGKSCGEILRMACMAIGAFPRAASETGYLAVTPLWSQGGTMTLDNMETYPVIRANDDLAAIIFTLADGSGTQLVVSGTSTASSNTVQVNNPFIHDRAAALTAARLILSTYGGNKLETTGRGDPASEIGDVDTVWLDESIATAGRRMSQTFSIQDGVLRGCQSVLLQADGGALYENAALITSSGSWTAPEGVSQLSVDIGGGGSGGQPGTDGTWDAAGEDGAPGEGGLIWSGTISINPGQTFQVFIGKGGAPGQPGTATTFGAYSSAIGENFDPNYVDISTGNAYCRDGVALPLPGSGDGGAGGAGGVQGNRHEERRTITDDDGESIEVTVTVVDNYPGAGQPGVAGADGFVLVRWEKEGT